MSLRTSNPRQITIISLEDLVPKKHIYRQLLTLVNFEHLTTILRKKFPPADVGAPGDGITTLFKCLLIQFLENLSDRELERFVQESTAAKYFCGFSLKDTRSYPVHQNS